MTLTSAPTPAATCSGVLLRQSRVWGADGHTRITSATTSTGASFLTMACRNDMPLNSLVVEMTLERAWKALGFCNAMALNVLQSLLSMMFNKSVKYVIALALRPGASGLVMMLRLLLLGR